MHVNLCTICGSATGVPHRVREMMLGTRDEFLYWECTDCGCLALVDVPNDLGRYYPNDYYSLAPRPPQMLRKLRDLLYLSWLSFLVSWRPRTDLDVIRRLKLTRDMTVLDVGCGAGSLLSDLRELGYNAIGIDPFVLKDIRDRFGVRVQRKTLAEIDGKYDVILFRHSLEHMPQEMLRKAGEHLKTSGVCVVSLPLLAWAWMNYKTDWVQLDAPRHWFLHTRRSFGVLAEKSGFKIDRVVYDSNEFQFWGSESYRQNIPLREMLQPNRRQCWRMRRLAKDLNSQEQGDTAQFYLKLDGGALV